MNEIRYYDTNIMLCGEQASVWNRLGKTHIMPELLSQQALRARLYYSDNHNTGQGIASPSTTTTTMPVIVAE